jgi:FSR family fosmidomycin resistance protein-like MFS transporter
MSALSAGHLFTDLNQGAVAALLPFFISERGLSLATAGALVLAATLSSSIVQPAFGFFSDKRPLPLLMPGGIVLAGLGIALSGLAPSYWAIFAAIVLSGLGVAAFHPEAARFANYVSGSGRARGMSFFSVGGNAGFALGPVVATPLVVVFGLHGTLFLLVPALVMGFVLLRELPRLRGFQPEPVAAGSAPAEGVQDRWGAFALVGGVVAMRSFVYFGLVSFVGAYYVRELGATPLLGNGALSAMLFAGAVGTLVLGPVADRVGRKAVLVGSMISLPPLLFAFANAGPIVGVALLALVGAVTIGTFGVTVVMGQEYLPARIGTAAGITMGLSIGLGGLGAPIFGAVADRLGLHDLMLVLAALPVLGLVFALMLPSRQGGGRSTG